MKKPIQIQILGDVCPAWGFRKSFDEGDESKVFGDTLPLLQKADLTIANLECPLSHKGTPTKKTGPRLRGKPSDMSVLKRAGVDVVSLANNHILDYGQEAFFDTLKAAQAEGILTVGAAQNLTESKTPLMIEKGDMCIGIMSFAEEEFSIASDSRGGASLFDPYCAFDEIAEARKKCDYLIILYHGGIEHYELPSPLLQKKCRKMIQSGADLVLCQHSHCIGSFETYQDGAILYGQGNAVFGRREGNTRWNQGMLVSVELTEGTHNISFRVFEANDEGISLLPNEAERITQMNELSMKLDDSAFIQEKWDAFCNKQEAGYIPELLGWGRVRIKLNRMLKNRLARTLISRHNKMITMNLIRCDAHREVVQTVLENSQK